MELNLEFANMTAYCVMEEGTLVVESKVSEKKHLYLPNGAKSFTLDAGNLLVGKLLSLSPALREMGYEVGEFVGYTYIGRQEFKHGLLKHPVILVPNTSIVGKIKTITLESIQDSPNEYFYERWFPASERGISEEDQEKYKSDEGEWSSGRENTNGLFAKGKPTIILPGR